MRRRRAFGGLWSDPVGSLLGYGAFQPNSNSCLQVLSECVSAWSDNQIAGGRIVLKPRIRGCNVSVHLCDDQAFAHGACSSPSSDQQISIFQLKDDVIELRSREWRTLRPMAPPPLWISTSPTTFPTVWQRHQRISSGLRFNKLLSREQIYLMSYRVHQCFEYVSVERLMSLLGTTSQRHTSQ